MRKIKARNQADFKYLWNYLYFDMVELSGIEPLTSSLRTRRSPS